MGSGIVSKSSFFLVLSSIKPDSLIFYTYARTGFARLAGLVERPSRHALYIDRRVSIPAGRVCSHEKYEDLPSFYYHGSQWRGILNRTGQETS